jgi:hypothetical protein
MMGLVLHHHDTTGKAQAYMTVAQFKMSTVSGKEE